VGPRGVHRRVGNRLCDIFSAGEVEAEDGLNGLLFDL